MAAKSPCMRKTPKKLRVVELYAGLGRSAEPFRKWKGATLSLLVDANPYVASVYRRNLPSAPYLVQDLRHVGADWIREKAGGNVDILLACPPCQGFSDNGHRNPWDHRNRHLRAYARTAVALRPKAIAMENVPLAVSARAFKSFTGMIAEAGYKWTAGIVNAALYGSVQCRQRLIFVAIRDDIGVEPQIPQPTHGGGRKYFNYSTRELSTLRESRNALLGVAPATFQVRDLLPYKENLLGTEAIPNVAEVLEGLPRLGTGQAAQLSHVAWSHSAKQLRRMSRVSEGGQARRAKDYYSQSYGRLHRRGLARTITGAFPNAGSGRFWHPTENRTITLREAARIQGFDDGFTFDAPYSHAALAVGNALDQALAELTFRIIRDCLS